MYESSCYYVNRSWHPDVDIQGCKLLDHLKSTKKTESLWDGPSTPVVLLLPRV